MYNRHKCRSKYGFHTSQHFPEIGEQLLLFCPMCNKPMIYIPDTQGWTQDD